MNRKMEPRQIDKREFKSEENVENLLDDVNRRIIDLLVRDPLISQIDVAKKLGMSQSSIAVRIDKLRRRGIIYGSTGLDLEKLNLKMGRVDVSTSDIETALAWAHKCPLLVGATLGIGGENLTLFIAAEDLEMFQYIVEHHIRKLKGVTGIAFSPILRWSNHQYVPLPLALEKKKSPPCEVSPYCPRCPSNPLNNGKLWRGAGDGHT